MARMTKPGLVIMLVLATTLPLALSSEAWEYPCRDDRDLAVVVKRPDGSTTEPLHPPRAAKVAGKLRTQQRERVDEGGEPGGFVGQKWVSTGETIDWTRATPEQMHDLIWCLAPHLGLEGSEERILAIEECESGCRPEADSGAHCGAFQHDKTYWDGRAAHYYEQGASCYDGFANTWVSMSMMAEGGWSHWTCDPG